MSAPVDLHGPALSQVALPSPIHAMASTHVDAVEPRCDGVQFVEKPARFVGKWPAKIGKAPPVSFQGNQMIVQAKDPPGTGCDRVKSGQPPRAPLSGSHAVRFIRIQD